MLCLGEERECSIQRRKSAKLIEEAPAPGLSSRQRTLLVEAAARLGSALRYRSLGTVEFLLDRQGELHFIEINPRIQVEHPVTEMVTGMDLVHEQLRLAAGRTLRYRQDEVTVRGAAIEARVLAESILATAPSSDGRGGVALMPATGEITYLKEPGGPGIRVDSALYQGMEVTADYDSLLAKVIAWGPTRAVALVRLRRALHEFRIGGVETDLSFLQQILSSVPFISEAGSIRPIWTASCPAQRETRANGRRRSLLQQRFWLIRPKPSPGAATLRGRVPRTRCRTPAVARDGMARANVEERGDHCDRVCCGRWRS